MQSVKLAPEQISFQGQLRSRRSVRRFLVQPVPRTTLRNILETGTSAPSAHNRQPWRFVVIEEDHHKAALADQMAGAFHADLLKDGMLAEQAAHRVQRARERLLNAPVIVLLCLTMEDMDHYPDDRRMAFEHLMAAQSVAMAGQNILLAAHGEGLGGVWVCSPLFAQPVVRRALNLPENWEPQGLLYLGYPAGIPEPRERKPLDDVAVFLSDHVSSSEKKA